MPPANHALAWHLQCNFYPPVTAKMIPACKWAIEKVNADEPDAVYAFPSGKKMTAMEIVSGLRLEDMIEVPA